MTGDHFRGFDGVPLDPADPNGPRVLVTLHLPLTMTCVAAVLRAMSDTYPQAVIGEAGRVLDRPTTKENPL